MAVALNTMLNINYPAKSSKKTSPSAGDKEVAATVARFAGDRGWRVSRSKARHAEAVRLLRQDINGPSPKTISEVVAQYVKAHLSGKTTFRVRDGHDLRRHWEIVQDIARKMPPAASDTAVQLAKDSSVYRKWPKVTLEQVAGFAQQCLNISADLSARLTKLKKTLKDRMAEPRNTPEKKSQWSRDKVLLDTAETLHGIVVSGPSYVGRHLKTVLDNVKDWKDWGGDFTQYMPTIDNTKKAWLKREALRRGVSEVYWNQLKEMLK